jgi:RNA polymerase sigma factor (sigma-70 family)
MAGFITVTPIHQLLSRIHHDREFGQGRFETGYFDRHEGTNHRITLQEIVFPAGERRVFELVDEAGQLRRKKRVRFHVWRLLYGERTMTDDVQLLRRYAEDGSEPAFGELVARYLDLVYSVAIRQVEGDAQLAQDVAQTVFVALARKARVLPKDVVLGGWLYRHTCFVARQSVRTERRRRVREQEAATMNALTADTEPAWEHLAPFLDEAMQRLGARDRDAIVLRYFERRDLRAVGTALGSSDEAARKRLSRALEKLGRFFKRRGLNLSATGLAALLTGHAVTAAPIGLAATVTSSAVLAGATAGTGIAYAALKLMSMLKLKVGIASAVLVAGLVTPLVLQHQSLTKLRDENTALREQSQLVAQLQEENERLKQAQVDAEELDRLRAEHNELLRLRGEVSGTKRQLAEAVKVRERTAPAPQAQPEVDPVEQQKQMAIAKLDYTRGWCLALFLYAEEHQGQFPANFDLAASFLPDEAKDQTNLSADQFEILYQGSRNDATNPNNVIMIREKEAWQTLDGGWVRAYGFVDGHSEIHKADDGHFGPWEDQRRQKPSGQ